MRRLSAQLIITNAGECLKKGIITVDADGSIVSVENTNGDIRERSSTEFYNGVIVPGFVNSHCHLELSHLKGKIEPGKGLGKFIMQIRSIRNNENNNILTAALSADREMADEGVVLCADICNTSLTFELKKRSRIRYINLLEVFGIDPENAGKRMDELISLEKAAKAQGVNYSIVPHAPYSVSLTLFGLLKEKTRHNKVTSLHFMETESESLFMSEHTGPLRKSYEAGGILPKRFELPANHIDTVLKEVTASGNLILVHNTFVNKAAIHGIRKRANVYWCLCPISNWYIEQKLPPVDLLLSEGCLPVTGTDSLASNKRLSILSELKHLQQSFSSVTLQELIMWATLNGARALGEEKDFGSIEPGKKPGLLLLENLDLKEQKLLPGTSLKRLV